MSVAQDRLGLRKRMVGDPTIIGNPSGRMSGLAVTESGTGFQVHESPRASLGMSPQLDDRNKFKEFLYNKYELSGKRPASESEIISRIMSESQAKESALSQHVFGERGRETGNKEHDVIWNKALTQMRNNIKTRIMGEVSGQKEDYDHKKSMIDEELKVYDSYTGKKAGAKAGLTPSQEIGYNQKRFAHIQGLNETFETNNPRPLKPEKDKDLPAYNKEIKKWNLARTIMQNKGRNDYDSSVLGEEEARKKIRRRFVRTGTDDETGQKIYANAYGEEFTDRACTKLYVEGEVTKPSPGAGTGKEKPKKKTEKELRKALYAITGKRDDLFPSTHKPLKKAGETLGKIGRGVLSLGNRPVRGSLSRYSEKKAGLR